MERQIFKEEHHIFRDAFKKFVEKEEYPICRFARDIRVVPIFAGTTEVMKVIVGRIMYNTREKRKRASMKPSRTSEVRLVCGR